MSQRIATARDEIAEAMCVVMRARDVAPEIESELQQIDDRLASIRHRLEEIAGPAPEQGSTVGSLYSYTASSDDPEWEARLIAVMTVQVHARTARSSLFGPEPGEDAEDEEDEPVPTLEHGDELKQAFDDIENALTAARERLRELPH